MKRSPGITFSSLALASMVIATSVLAQPPGGPGGAGGPFGGGPGMMRATRKILKEFDKNDDGWLNSEERAVAREALKKQQAERGGLGGRGPGGPGGFGPPGMNRNQTPPKPGV